MTDPQMEERRAALVRAALVRFAESSPQAAEVGSRRGVSQGVRHGQRRVALVTAVVLAVVSSISVAALTATGGLDRHPAAPIEVTESASPSVGDPQAAALLPVVWHVHDAAGEGTGTWLRFDVHEIDVLRPKGYVLVSWTTRQNEMIAVVSTWYRGLHGADTTVPWLTESTRFVRDGAGWHLLDAAGRITARLEDDGPRPPSKVILETPVEVTAAVRAELADTRLPTRAGIDAGASIVGTWAGSPPDASHRRRPRTRPRPGRSPRGRAPDPGRWAARRSPCSTDRDN